VCIGLTEQAVESWIVRIYLKNKNNFSRRGAEPQRTAYNKKEHLKLYDGEIIALPPTGLF
jgi:hypothetical protein